MTFFHGPYTVRVDDVTEAEWNSLVDRFADASIYQTWAYGAITWGESQLSHLVMLRNGVPVAIAQSRIIRVPLVGRGIAYVRWGPVCKPKGSQYEPAVWQAAANVLIEEYVRRRGLAIRILPFLFAEEAVAPAIAAIFSQAGFVTEDIQACYRTLLVDLKPPQDILRKRLAHKWRNQLNAAERGGLEVHEGTDTILYDEFSGIYDEMVTRKRFDTTVSVPQFRKIQERLPASQKLSILIGRKDGVPVSGLVASSIGGTGVYLLGATGDAGMKVKGSYLLQWRLLQRMRAHGCEWYDLGGINPGTNPGVYHFKMGLGGSEVHQLSRYDLHPNRLSKFAVGTAQRLRIVIGRLRATAKSGLPQFQN